MNTDSDLICVHLCLSVAKMFPVNDRCDSLGPSDPSDNTIPKANKSSVDQGREEYESYSVVVRDPLRQWNELSQEDSWECQDYYERVEFTVASAKPALLEKEYAGDEAAQHGQRN